MLYLPFSFRTVVCGAPAFWHHYTFSLVQWSTVCFLARGAAVRVLGCPNTLGTGILLFSCWRCLATLVTPSWSLITSYDRSSDLSHRLLSNPLFPVPFSLKATDKCDIPLGSCKAQSLYLGGACGALSFTHHYTVSWSSRSTVCFPPSGVVVCIPGMHPHFWNRNSPVSNVSLHVTH